MLVEIRRLQKKKWHGKEGENSFARPFVICPLVNSETMSYCVSLTDKEKKSFEAQFRGYDLSTNFAPNDEKNIWNTKQARVALLDEPFFLNLDLAHDQLKYKVCEGSKFVANSLEEYNLGKFPEATHVMYNEEAENKEKATKLQTRNKVISKMMGVSKETKIQLVTVLAGKTVNIKSDETIEVEINRLIENNPELIIRYLDMDKDALAITSLVHKAVSIGVITKDGATYKYFEDVIGYSVDEVVTYLKDVTNSKLRIRITEQVTQ